MNSRLAFIRRWFVAGVIACALIAGAAFETRAAEKFCSDYPDGVIDGLVDPVPTQITIDQDCTFQNFPYSKQLDATLNFQTNDDSRYFIIFNNVYYTGNMACSNIDHRLWFVNGSYYGVHNECQDLFIPVEMIAKHSPSATAIVGVPFTYTLTLPAMNGDPEVSSPNTLHSIVLTDNLTETGADLTYVSDRVVHVDTNGNETQLGTDQSLGDSKHLEYEFQQIPAGEQIKIEVTVVLDSSTGNVPGTSFTNTAKWSFGRIFDEVMYEPLPGESGISEPMTIVGPDLVVTKTSDVTAIEQDTQATFTIDVLNSGDSDAWHATILDEIPDGMCEYDPTPGVSAEISGAAGVTTLVEGTDYTVTYNSSPTCRLDLTMVSDVAVIGPSEHLIITYQSELNAMTAENNLNLTNVAGATQWYSSGGAYPPAVYNETLSDGTPGVLDFQDSETVVTAVDGYFFQKTVENLTSGANPATAAAPGDRLRYRLRLVSVDKTIEGITISDLLDPNSFDLSTFAMVPPLPGGADYSFNFGTGLLTVTGDSGPLAVAANGEIEIAFDVTLKPVLADGTMVLNQALLTADDPASATSNETATLIYSSPEFEVLKTSADVTGDPAVVMPGDTLRYTISIENTGDEDAVDVRLQDDTPANCTYVAGSTTLNGVALSDPNSGESPLQDGILVNAPEDTTAGYLHAESGMATVTFDVIVDPDAVEGLIIENQGFVTGSGAGSGPLPEQPTDDPGTPVADDPTRDIVGYLPLLYAHKTVQIEEDFTTPGVVDPGDVLAYTIVISNSGPVPATGVVLSDRVPPDTTYVEDSMTLNGASLGSDGGVSPLIAGLPVFSGDNPGDGIVSAGGSAEITFEVEVNEGVPAGTIISNQGSVASGELPATLTDADGLPSNGLEPTVVVVGDVQLLEVTKEVAVTGGGIAEAGGQLIYTIRVTNISSVPATRVVVTDDLGPPLGDQVAYIDGSGTMNGSPAGVTFSGGILTADYAAQYGTLPPGERVVVRFRVQIDSALTIGTPITNTGVVHWNGGETDSASVTLDVGGTPGSFRLGGQVWHDANLDKLCDANTETRLEGWTVTLYRNSDLVATRLTDADGGYQFTGLQPNEGTEDTYEVRFQAAGATPYTPSLGWGDSPLELAFTNAPQRIGDIFAAAGANLQNLNLPLWPNGIVYDSVARQPVSGAGLALLNAATGDALPDVCFDDPAQQHQVTALDGFYKFDLNFSDAACPAGGAYLIEVTPPQTGYMEMPSQVIPPASDASTEPFSVPDCPGNADDAIAATDQYCEVLSEAGVPPRSVPALSDGTRYYLHLLLDDGLVPGHSQVFNNPIPIDPDLYGAVSITKTCSMVNVARGDLVPYTITVSNINGAPLYDMGILDRIPAGFKYVAGSARLDGEPAEPNAGGRELLWDGIELGVNAKHTLRLLLVVGAGVSEGRFVNRAQAVNTLLDTAVSEEATAAVLVAPDPDFDCTDVIGKVFDDRNLNGRQDDGEDGLPGVRAVTARGLIATSDEYGRFHITCAAVPDEDRGSNFILKLDERSLPSGYRLTTENPRVQRATRGKMLRFNFGAAIHRVVRLDIADGVFEPETSDLRLQWTSKIAELVEELKKGPSVLRLSYLGDVEGEGLVERRLEALKKEISRQWESSAGGYRLTIETEVYWRRGAPVANRR